VGDLKVLNRTSVVTEVEPQHTEESIDGARIAAAGKRSLGNRAGLLKPARSRGGERVAKCVGSRLVKARRRCSLNCHDISK
jgi:hypothetical protein